MDEVVEALKSFVPSKLMHSVWIKLFERASKSEGEANLFTAVSFMMTSNSQTQGLHFKQTWITKIESHVSKTT